MNLGETTKTGLVRSFGWKKNILAVLASFLLCLAAGLVEAFTADTSFLHGFDLTRGIIPLLGFLLGIWAAYGCMLYILAADLVLMYAMTGGVAVGPWMFLSALSMGLYCVLPAVLWYLFPLKGEERGTYPRLKTSAHVIKYYLIMVGTLAVYIGFYQLISGGLFTGDTLLNLMALYTQYLDMVLIVGMPAIIVVSRIRYKTIYINERMVLAFLNIGVIASLLAGYLLYRTSYHLDPALFVDYKAVMHGTAEITDTTFETIDRYISFWNWYYILLAIMLNAVLVIEMLFMRNIEKKVTNPVRNLSHVLGQYAKHEDGGLDPKAVEESCRTYRTGFGEVSSLTNTCVDMAEEIDTYTKDLRRVTAEQERISTELDVAARIQREMLPRTFPPFPDHPEIDLFASMVPAKEVGGDFYDFYLIDEDHLALTIADVSGKGVPAALFMAISKSLLKNQAQTGGSPKEILGFVNRQLCQNNDSSMFCTVWLGILDLTSGKLTAANAGHEYPVIRRKAGQFELLRDKHTPALGVMDGICFREYELTLAPGDCLFQYTDGVTEAADEGLALYGEERLVDALNEATGTTPESLIGDISAAVAAFAGSAPQADDMTMLCVVYHGPVQNG